MVWVDSGSRSTVVEDRQGVDSDLVVDGRISTPPTVHYLTLRDDPPPPPVTVVLPGDRCVDRSDAPSLVGAVVRFRSQSHHPSCPRRRGEDLSVTSPRHRPSRSGPPSPSQDRPPSKGSFPLGTNSR